MPLIWLHVICTEVVQIIWLMEVRFICCGSNRLILAFSQPSCVILSDMYPSPAMQWCFMVSQKADVLCVKQRMLFIQLRIKMRQIILWSGKLRQAVPDRLKYKAEGWHARWDDHAEWEESPSVTWAKKGEERGRSKRTDEVAWNRSMECL